MNSVPYECRVSSVLNRDIKQYGKTFLFDGNEETCWSSDQGLPQWVEVAFSKEKNISSLVLQFQGGFVGQDCLIEMKKADNTLLVHPFYPEDINTPQTFLLDQVRVKSVRVVFRKSTDLFGRIVVYNLCFNE